MMTMLIVTRTATMLLVTVIAFLFAVCCYSMLQRVSIVQVTLVSWFRRPRSRLPLPWTSYPKSAGRQPCLFMVVRIQRLSCTDAHLVRHSSQSDFFGNLWVICVSSLRQVPCDERRSADFPGKQSATFILSCHLAWLCFCRLGLSHQRRALRQAGLAGEALNGDSRKP